MQTFSFSKTTFSVMAFLLFVACMQFAAGGEVNVSFGKDKWDKSKWLEVKSPRWSYLGKMVQNEDHIVNYTPDLSDEIIFKKYASKVYSGIVYNKVFTGKKVEITTVNADT